MSSFNVVLEKRCLKYPRLGPPDFYPQDPKQREDELTSVNVKQGFINQLPFSESEEHGSGINYNINLAKLNKSFNDIVAHKQFIGTFNDSGKKRPQLTKDNFWLVPVAKNRNHVQQWIKDLRGSKSLNSLARKVPIFTRKEEVFQTIAESQVTILRGAWYIKMTAAYNVLQAEAKNKKNRITVDLNPEWTVAICKFMRDQLAKLIDEPSLANPNNPALAAIMQQSKEEMERQFDYICKVSHYMYSEGMLDRHEYLTWVVETMEKIRLHGTHALSYIVPIVFKYIQEIVKNQLLSRRLAYVCCRLLNWLLNESSWGPPTPKSSSASPSGPQSVGPPSVSGQHQRLQSAPPTPGQPKTSPQKSAPPNATPNQQPLPTKLHPLPPNFPEHLNDLAYFLICFVQCITLECPGALVWFHPDDPKIPGSPLDYLPVAPSVLPLPIPKQVKVRDEDKNLRTMLRDMEFDIMQRSFASEMKWSSDKCQESATGQTINRVLHTLEALDKQQNFDRTDPIEPLYNKIFPTGNNKDSNEQASNLVGEEAVIWLLCEWAISPKRLGEHRAAVVAKLLDKRQMQIESDHAVEVAERTKAMNSASSTTCNSNPTSVATILSSPPPQLLVEGVEMNQNESNPPQNGNPMMGGATHLFQNLLFNFLDSQAPTLENPLDKEELQSFRNLVVLFYELIQHDVFSHDQYVSALITKGDIVPGHISPLPIYQSSSSSANSSMNMQSHDPRRSSMGPPSILHPASVGGPVSNKQLDMILKDAEDDLPSSVPISDPKNEDLALFSPINDFMMSPDGRPAIERHFTDVMRTELSDPKDAKSSSNNATPSHSRKPIGPIWGYRQPRHMQYLMHFPISFEEEGWIHESNQRLMVLYGAIRQRNEVKKAVKKITKYLCKLVQKKSVTANENLTSGVPSVGGSKKSKNRSGDCSPYVLLNRFRCLSYFDQHAVTSQAAKAIINSFTEYTNDRSQNLPQISSITLVLNLMEDGLNIGGMVQLAVQISSMLVPLETEIARKHPNWASCYTKDLALGMVSVLRHYQSYLTLNVDLTLQAFESLHAFINQSNVTNPAHCTSSDRCVLIFLFDLYASFPYRTKHVVEKFASSASVIKQTLYQSTFPATSNCRYDSQFLSEYIQQPNFAHPLLVARQNFLRLRESTNSYKYSFVCSAIIAMCSGQPNPESLSAIATLCAEMNAQCNDLSSEWLGVLKALCCSSLSANFNDVLLSVDPGDVNIRDPLALFTAILIARNCLNLEDFIQHVAIPSLLAACASKPGLDVTDAETGARLTCHILLQLFKTPTHPSQANDPSNPDAPTFYLPEAADRHLLAASQRNIIVGAVLAVLKAIVKLGDTSFEGSRSSAPSDSDPGVTSFLAPIGCLDECDDFGIMGQPKTSASKSGSLDTASLSEFAKHSVRIICSQQWVRERCLKNIVWDLFMDPELTGEQMQNLVQLICCPDEELQRLTENPKDQQTYVMRVLQRMSRWTLRQTLLELQIMLKQANHDESLSDDIARAVIEVFKTQQVESTKDRKSPITGLELDKSNVWLMPSLVSELSSQVQAKVLHEASNILETQQHWSKSDRDRNSKNPASLLSQQPFLTLILTCLKGQDEQRDSLLDSLQSQILMFHSEWHNGRQQQIRDISNPKDNSMSQAVVQEALQLRLSLMGGMFDTVQNSSHWTSNVVVLLTQLINSGMVDVEVNAKLFHTVFDMIAVLLHSTLGGDSPTSGEARKRDYLTVVKKIKKEISDGKSASLEILRKLLPIPKKETYVVACEPVVSGLDRQGLKIVTKQKIVPWDIIEGLKNTAPLCLSWFSASKTERKELKYDVQQRLMICHDHEAWQRPQSEYLTPPELPEEEEEKPPTPKVESRNPESRKRKKSIMKSPGSAATGNSMHPPSKKAVVPKKKREPKMKKRDETTFPRNMTQMPYLGPAGGGMMSQSVHPVHTSGLPNFGNTQDPNFPIYSNHQPPVMNPYPNQSNHQKYQSAQIKHSLAQLIKTKSGQQQFPHNQPQGPQGNIHAYQSLHPSASTENSKSALLSKIRRNSNLAGNMGGDMAGMPFRTRQPNMGPPMSTNLRHITPQTPQQSMGYNNYGNAPQGNMGQMHSNMRSTGTGYNSYQGPGGPGQQQNYHQVMPNQSYMNQSQNSGVGSGYSMGNMPMQSMNQGAGYNMQGPSMGQNQSGMMGGQQPPQYGVMQSQQGRQISRMGPQQMGGGGQGAMMQMHRMVGPQNTMNDPMRQRQMMNQGMPMNSQFVQQQQTTQLVNNLRRNMPPNQGGPMF